MVTSGFSAPVSGDMATSVNTPQPLNYFHSQTLKWLQEYLKTKGVTLDGRKKDQLAVLAFKSQVLEATVSVDDSLQDSQRRRTVDSILLPHPGTLSNWDSNLRSIPLMSLDDVLFYCGEVCEWPKHRLKRFKDDSGYQLHIAKHVMDVSMHEVGARYVYIRSKCVPETRQSEPPYASWALLNLQGDVVSGECTCVAGNGTCKHVIALLFGVADLCEQMESSPTSLPCRWKNNTRVKAQPIPISKLILQPSHTCVTDSNALTYNPFPGKLSGDKFVHICEDVLKLVKGTNALIITSLTQASPHSDTGHIDNLPPTITEIIHHLSHATFNSFLESARKHFVSTTVSAVELATKGQAANYLWHSFREGMLTASNFHSVLSYKGEKPDNHIVKRISGFYGEVRSEAIKYGLQKESVARRSYTKKHKKVHPQCSVNTTGLRIHKSIPFLGASPDGMVTCPVCGTGLLEIKAPYTKRLLSCKEACQDRAFHCEWINGEIKLKKKSPWFTQIQGQMLVYNMKFCDFVCYTEKDMQCERIVLDTEFAANLSERLKTFYESFIFPYLLENSNAKVL